MMALVAVRAADHAKQRHAQDVHERVRSPLDDFGADDYEKGRIDAMMA